MLTEANMNSRFVDKNIVGSSTERFTDHYNVSSPTPKEEVSFNWLNIDFPFWHDHDHWEIYIVTQGTLTHSINNVEYTMSAGDACLIRPSDLHKISYSKNNNSGHHIVFLFTNSYAKKIFSTLNSDTINEIVNNTTPLQFRAKNFPLSQLIDTTLTLSVAGLSAKEKTFKTKLIIDALFSDFLLQYFVKTSIFPQWLSDFLLILNNPKLKESTVELAKYTPYSYSRLSRIFKEYMETTIIDYIKNVKYKHACNLLINTDMTVLEISNELYYDSISYFNKIFKSYSNMTPTEYRNKTKNLTLSQKNN